MLDELFAIHREVTSNIATKMHRYLYDQIHWNSQAICVLGDRGVGKTTLLCQRLIQEYETAERALYISADNINVSGKGLFKIAQEYFTYGGEAIFIDEVHKYPNWSIEIKNIIDTFKRCKIVFSASSSLDLKKSKADLSRRIVYYQLHGLSFREYIHLNEGIVLPTYTLKEILKNHVSIADKMGAMPMLKFFRNYLSHGYYPFFVEGLEDYLSKLNNVIEKVIFEDIAVVFNLRQTTLPVLKKILWLVATTDGLTPNIDHISSSLAVSREVIYNCLEYLGHSGLLLNLYHEGEGIKLIRKPAKIYLNNTNLLWAINGTLKRDGGIGGARETFFANQLQPFHKVALHSQTDFLVDKTYSFEIGGKSKDYHQIKDLEDSYLVVDNISIGYGNKIPLYLFGFLY
jgi:uncharacterized protein